MVGIGIISLNIFDKVPCCCVRSFNRSFIIDNSIIFIAMITGVALKGKRLHVVGLGGLGLWAVLYSELG